MNHSFEADFFALGVIIYEMMMGVVLITLFRDPIMVILENKLGIRSLHIKPKYHKNSCPRDGVFNPWIL
jgi:hypothetical protein